MTFSIKGALDTGNVSDEVKHKNDFPSNKITSLFSVESVISFLSEAEFLARGALGVTFLID